MGSAVYALILTINDSDCLLAKEGICGTPKKYNRASANEYIRRIHKLASNASVGTFSHRCGLLGICPKTHFTEKSYFFLRLRAVPALKRFDDFGQNSRKIISRVLLFLRSSLARTKEAALPREAAGRPRRGLPTQGSRKSRLPASGMWSEKRSMSPA